MLHVDLGCDTDGLGQGGSALCLKGPRIDHRPASDRPRRKNVSATGPRGNHTAKPMDKDGACNVVAPTDVRDADRTPQKTTLLDDVRERGDDGEINDRGGLQGARAGRVLKSRARIRRRPRQTIVAETSARSPRWTKRPSRRGTATAGPRRALFRWWKVPGSRAGRWRPVSRSC